MSESGASRTSRQPWEPRADGSHPEAGRYNLTPCLGWSDEGYPNPTCFPHGCELLDVQGSCPGNGLSASADSETGR